MGLGNYPPAPQPWLGGGAGGGAGVGGGGDGGDGCQYTKIYFLFMLT